MRRDVGEMGEKVLEQWAAEVGVTANKALRDRSGWDFVLELPDDASSGAAGGRPLDRVPGPSQCWIQVKSTDRRNARWPVKLDNWRRLVATPSPSFLLVLEFDGASYAQRAYLVHVGEPLMRAVLLELRRAGAAHPPVPLHKRTLPFRYAAEDAILPLNGSGLLGALRRHVGPSADAYVTEKQRLLRGLGYEDGGEVLEVRASISLRRAPADAEEHAAQGGDELDDEHVAERLDQRLIDFALGVAPELPLQPGTTVWDERFGIRHPEPVRTFATAGKLVANPLGDGEVRLRTARGDAVALPIRVFSSGAVGFLVRDPRLYVRLEARYVEFTASVLDPKASPALAGWTIHLRIPDPDAPQPLDGLLELAELLRVLRGCGPTAPATVDVTVNTGGERFQFGGPVVLPKPDAEYDALARTIEEGWTVLRRFGLPADVPVSINDLWRQRVAITRLHAALAGDPGGARIDVALDDADSDSMFDEHRPTCVPVLWHADVGGRRLALAFAAVGRLRAADAEPRAAPAAATDRRYVLPVDAIEAVETASYAAAADVQVLAPDLLERVARRYDAMHLVLRWWLADPPRAGAPGENAS